MRRPIQHPSIRVTAPTSGTRYTMTHTIRAQRIKARASDGEHDTRTANDACNATRMKCAAKTTAPAVSGASPGRGLSDSEHDMAPGNERGEVRRRWHPPGTGHQDQGKPRTSCVDSRPPPSRSAHSAQRERERQRQTRQGSAGARCERCVDAHRVPRQTSATRRNVTQCVERGSKNRRGLV